MYLWIPFLIQKTLMPRTFIYARVSTLEQKADNQLKEIQSAGFDVKSHRIIKETVSGAPLQRMMESEFFRGSSCSENKLSF